MTPEEKKQLDETANDLAAVKRVLEAVMETNKSDRLEAIYMPIDTAYQALEDYLDES